MLIRSVTFLVVTFAGPIVTLIVSVLITGSVFAQTGQSTIGAIAQMFVIVLL